jgi:hypothetical protein
MALTNSRWVVVGAMMLTGSFLRADALAVRRSEFRRESSIGLARDIACSLVHR